MKRPFAVICIVFLIFISVLQVFRRSDEDRLILQTEQILIEYAGEKQHVAVQGTVHTCSRMSTGIRLYLDHITVSQTDESELSLLPDTQIIITTEEETVFPGDRILVYGELSFWENAANPGAFDSREYYLGDNIVCSISKPKIIQCIPGKDSIKRRLSICRRKLETSFYHVLDEKTAGTIAAVCLGEKGGMDMQWKETFQEGGIAHILAVSGLHITWIGTGIYQILRRAGGSLLISALLSGMVVALYAVMTGLSISAVRAVMMYFIWLGAQILGRKYDMITSVSAAAILLLLKDSSTIQDTSFLLSFSAILVLAILVPAVNKSCGIRYPMINQAVTGILVWIGTLPVTLFFFYQTAPWSFLLNLLVVPWMSLLMVSGLGAAVVGCFHIASGIFLSAPVYYLLHFFEWLCQMQKKLPVAVWITGRPQAWKIVLFYLILTGCVLFSGWEIQEKTETEEYREKKQKKHRIYRNRVVWMTGLFFCIWLMCPQKPSELRITCIDVGQGDGAVLQMPTGEVFLVDGGSTSEQQVWKYQIEKTLKYYGISQIEGMFLSHDDQDHISGMEEYLDDTIPDIAVKCLYLPPTDEKEAFASLKEKAVQAGMEVFTVSRGSRIEAENGNWSIECLSPDSTAFSGSDNEDSMVLMVRYGAFQMLFTGDLEGETEKMLARDEKNLKADVLKVGHHGSANGSSEAFLQAVMPEISVISCGKNNRYGHPAEETLERLRAVGSDVFVTSECGAVQIVSDGEKYSVIKK